MSKVHLVRKLDHRDFNSENSVISAVASPSSKEQKTMLKASVSGKDVFSLHLTGFSKGLVKHRNTLWFATGQWRMSNVAPRAATSCSNPPPPTVKNKIPYLSFERDRRQKVHPITCQGFGKQKCSIGSLPDRCV